MIRTVLVDDSLTFRSTLRAILEEDGGFSVVGTAENGQQAVRLARELRPDLMIMDVVMPGKDGLETTSEIMHVAPCPVVILSSLMDTQEQQLVFDALKVGAVEVLGKPKDVGHKVNRDKLVAALRTMAGIKVVRRRTPGARPQASSTTTAVQLVVIGSSTGGPPALCEVLRHLPRDFPAPIVIAQHLATGFARGLRQWLSSSSKLSVQLLDKPTQLAAGTAYLAADDHHIEIRRTEVTPIRAGGEIPVPSVDRLFRSALSFGNGTVAILLTGMGRDGASALGLLRERGHHTIVQDEATSLVYGMPKEAKLAGAAVEELPLPDIGPRLVRLSKKV